MMNRDFIHRISDIQEQIRSDHVLMDDCEYVQASFLKMLPELAENQRDILMDYLGVCIEIHLRMLEMCCESEKMK